MRSDTILTLFNNMKMSGTSDIAISIVENMYPALFIVMDGIGRSHGWDRQVS